MVSLELGFLWANVTEGVTAFLTERLKTTGGLHNPLFRCYGTDIGMSVILSVLPEARGTELPSIL
jgi:hypothetical protein